MPQNIASDTGGRERYNDYIKQVEASGNRTRSLIYIILILDFLVIATVRNTETPNWSHAYLEQIDAYYRCWTADECKTPKLSDIPKLPDRHGLRLDSIKGDDLNEGNAVQREEYRSFIKAKDAWIQRNVEDNYISIPVFSFSINVNDLWAVILLLLVINMLLFASLNTELHNISVVSFATKEDVLLFKMTQVLMPTTPTPSSSEVIIYRVLPPIFFFLSVLVGAWILYIDWKYLAQTAILEWKAGLGFAVECAIFVCLFLVSCMCYREFLRIRRKIRSLDGSAVARELE